MLRRTKDSPASDLRFAGARPSSQRPVVERGNSRSICLPTISDPAEGDALARKPRTLQPVARSGVPATPPARAVIHQHARGEAAPSHTRRGGLLLAEIRPPAQAQICRVCPSPFVPVPATPPVCAPHWRLGPLERTVAGRGAPACPRGNQFRFAAAVQGWKSTSGKRVDSPRRSGRARPRRAQSNQAVR
jgi:hypothetical protein